MNSTHGRCDLHFISVEGDSYQDGCNASSGEFYSDPDSGDEPLHVCLHSDADGKKYQTDFIATNNYPFCAGSSCNESEIIMAYDAILLADTATGGLGAFLDSVCSSFLSSFLSRETTPVSTPAPTSTPTPTSMAYNRYTSSRIVDYIALAIMSIAIISR